MSGPAYPDGPPSGGPWFGPPQPGPGSGPQPGPYGPQPGPHPGPYSGPIGPQPGPGSSPYDATGPQSEPHTGPYGPPAGPQPGPDAQPYGGPPGPSPYGAPPHRPGPPYPGPPVPYGYGPPRQGFAAVDENTWALLAYIGQFAVGFVAPLVVYLARKDGSPYLRFHGAQALNLAVTSFLVILAGFVVSLATLGIGAIVAIPAMLAYGVAHVVFLVIAALRANKGEPYVIPKWLCWPIVR
ncbi:DUF4870 domain-containing protein [Actinoallomurus sp. NPDC052308]|uniref:DUF4870 domain-containing protein n=1 Tax=Actinoallomurus sp. NPDC052308 TaxID=3155530 RepID=UPI003448926C